MASEIGAVEVEDEELQEAAVHHVVAEEEEEVPEVGQRVELKSSSYVYNHVLEEQKFRTHTSISTGTT